jgi:hypothetical protein
VNRSIHSNGKLGAMNMNHRSHITVHRLATQLKAYPKALAFLAELNDIPLPIYCGMTWVSKDDAVRLTAAWEQWHNRPRLFPGKGRRDKQGHSVG